MSPAKVNVHLDVKERRKDGFHNLVSIFQLVELYDELHFCSLKDNNFCEIDGDFPVSVEENIISRSYRLFTRETGVKGGIRVHAKKIIPWGAGLGGGSSNAAATLFACNELFRTALDKRTLHDMGLALGSDVPFFLEAAAALVTGRGENIVPLKAPGFDFYVLIVVPDFQISTAAAYSWLDASVLKEAGGRTAEVKSSNVSRLIDQYEVGAVADWSFYNSFEDVLIGKYPEIGGILTKMYRNNAEYASVSGSGSAVFGIFLEKKIAQNAAEVFRTYYTRVWVVKPRRIRSGVEAKK